MDKQTVTTPDDKQGVQVIGHLLVRDLDTKEVLVNQRGTAKNTNGDQDED